MCFAQCRVCGKQYKKSEVVFFLKQKFNYFLTKSQFEMHCLPKCLLFSQFYSFPCNNNDLNHSCFTGKNILHFIAKE